MLIYVLINGVLVRRGFVNIIPPTGVPSSGGLGVTPLGIGSLGD